MVKQWGIPYAPPRQVGSVDANELAARAERNLPLGVVPEGCRFMTVAADCQLSHFEWIVRGWGERGESWVIDKGRLPADPATSADDWDKLLTDVFQKTYPLADDSGRMMPIRGCGYDSGGQPGVTAQAYAAFTRWSRTRREDGEKSVPVIRFFGESDGRKVYSIVPMKGNDKMLAKNLDIVFPETSRAANQKAGRGMVPVAMFNPTQYKDDLYGQLACAEPGPLYVHFPYALRSKEAPHVWFEQVTSEAKNTAGRWEKINPNARNEALDLMVMSHVVAKYHGLNRIDWTKPPSFARDWSENPFLIEPVEVVEEVVTDESGETVVVQKPVEKPEVKSRTTPTPKKSLIGRMA
jgi:phage terminase large subunit GpA-like protein